MSMARVETMAGIASISGRLGDYCFRTMHATGKVFMHAVKDRKAKEERRAPSEAERAHRERFAAVAKMVKQMRQSSPKSKAKSQKQLWKIAMKAYDAANQ